MTYILITILFTFLNFFNSCSGNNPSGNIYYVSPEGNDSYDGISQSSPWKTLRKVSQYGLDVGFKPGNIIMFEGGKIFESDYLFYEIATLLVSNSGTADSPIIFTSYGDSKATIKAGINATAILSVNNQYVEFRNLNVISEFNPFIQNNATRNFNNGIWFFINKGTNIRMRGIMVDNCYISRFINTGILLNYSDTVKTRIGGYGNVKITNCKLDSIGQGGIVMNWFRPNLYSVDDFPHKDVTIKNCDISHVTGLSTETGSNSGDGILLIDVDSALIEGNRVDSCGSMAGKDSGPSAIETAQCRRIIYQYNEACYQETPSGHDGGGFHFGDGVQNSIMQYNYSHHNAGPGFNCGTYNSGYPLRDSNNIIRYNISAENLQHSNYDNAEIAFGGGNGTINHNIYVLNNIIYVSKYAKSSGDAAAILVSQNVSNIFIKNNIIISSDTNAYLYYRFRGYENNLVIQGNLYWSAQNFYKFMERFVVYKTFASWQSATGHEKFNGINVAITESPVLLNSIGSSLEVDEKPLNNFSAFKTYIDNIIKENGLELK